MAHILIDGYNIIGTAHDDLAKERLKLVKQLREYSVIKKHNITLVFDGWKSGQGEQSRTRTGHLTIIYTRLGDTADEVIRSMLVLHDAKDWIVVSSDRAIYDFAEKRDFAAVRSDEFEDRLFSALYKGEANKIPDMQSGYKHESEGRQWDSRKGNPLKMSRKNRKKQQALKKL